MCKAMEAAGPGSTIDRTPDQLHQVSKEIVELGGALIQCVPLDVSQANQVHAGVREIFDLSGSIDVLVNCTGLLAMGASESTAGTEAAMLLNTNALGTLLVCQEVDRRMLARGRGRIINFAKNGELGDLVQVHAALQANRPATYYTNNYWRGTRAGHPRNYQRPVRTGPELIDHPTRQAFNSPALSKLRL
jgi:NAD(P)-dependent dehydrogenase (short-subunit alcohol dehydrogenase family)